MVTGAQALTEEFARTLHKELSRVGLLPDNEVDEWDRLPGRRREQWLGVSTAAFLSMTRARAAPDPAHGGCLSSSAAVLGAELSDRERTILEALSRKATIRQIAVHEYISPNTVKTHVRHIYRKLGISSRAEAAVAARTLGLSESQRTT